MNGAGSSNESVKIAMINAKICTSGIFTIISSIGPYRGFGLRKVVKNTLKTFEGFEYSHRNGDLSGSIISMIDEVKEELAI